MLKRLPGPFSLAAVVVCVGVVGGGQTPNALPLQDVPSHSAPASPDRPLTQAQGAQILAELGRLESQIKALGAPGALPRGSGPTGAPASATLRLDPEWPALGSSSAPVTVVEFTDLQCPFCRAFAKTAFPELKRDYIDTGRVYFVGRDLPLPMHRYALGAAEAERCAEEQGKFWPFRDAVLAETGPPVPGEMVAEAAKLGLNAASFGQCLTQRLGDAKVQADIAAARSLGLRATPAFIIGRVEVNGGKEVLRGTVIYGNRPLPYFQAAINAASAGARAKPSN